MDTQILRFETVIPKVILNTKLVEHPGALCSQGEAVFLCGGTESSLTLDFGQEIAGRVSWKAEASCAGTLAVYYGETVEEAERTEPFSCGWYELPVDRYALVGGNQKAGLESKGRRGFRYICIRASSQCAVKIRAVTAKAQRSVMEARGHFRCDQTRLNQIWDLSANTVSLCMQNFYEDGIKRDGLLWIGDYRASFLAAWYAFGDIALARKSLLMIAKTQLENGALPACASKGGGHQHPQEIGYMPGIPHGSVDRWVLLNYCTDYVSAVWEYVAYTGDCSILDELYTTIPKVTDFLWNNIDFAKAGQLKTEKLAKAVQGEPYYGILTDVITDPNQIVVSKGAFLFQVLSCLQDAGSLAVIRKDQEYRDNLKRSIEKLKRHLRENYYNGESRLYMDEPIQTKGEKSSQYPSLFAILAGMADADAAKKLVQSPTPLDGFMASWGTQGLFESGNGEEAIKRIMLHWGRMLDAGSVSCWERLDADEVNRIHDADAPCSYCHAWTAGPAWQLPMHILGIQPADIGFSTVVIKPNLFSLSWAEGTVPTPNGEIFLRIEQDENTVTIWVTIPLQIENCTLILPNGESRKVAQGIHRFIVQKERI